MAPNSARKCGSASSHERTIARFGRALRVALHAPAGQGGAGAASDAGLDVHLGGRTTPCGIEPETPVCGDQVIPALEDPPNLYFVIDASGSMRETLSGSRYNKYVNARIAVSVLLDAIGHRVRYGAAVFPSFSAASDGCVPGTQIYETARGDPPCSTLDGARGPKLQDLLTRLDRVQLGGGTPVAASLDALAPALLALPGKTWVVLITDGAPNCNYQASCGSDACIPNIEGLALPEQACTPSFNCCDPENAGPGAQSACIDAAESERAIADLAAAGVSTFVVGMPGSEPYVESLERMAAAGGTARPGAPAYYAVSDTASLGEALLGIGTGVTIQCDISLAELPPDRDLVNVYFDGQLVAYGQDDGWAWTGDQALEIRGEACTRLRSGTVYEVQILSGCQTVIK
jgi:hypothetical protein